MKTPDEIKKGLKLCGRGCYPGCPYKSFECVEELSRDGLEYIQQLETRGWELFDRLSSAWYWKGCYYKQDDGTVYSKASCQYLSFDQAIDEFATALTNAYKVE